MSKRSTYHSKPDAKRQREEALRRLHGPLWDFPCDDSEGDDDYPSVRCFADEDDVNTNDDLSDAPDDDDDDDSSSSSDVNDFIDDDDIPLAVQPTRVLKTTHMMDDAEKMAVVVNDAISKYCGHKVEPLDRYVLHFAEQPRALGQSKISGLWKDSDLVKAVKECVYSKMNALSNPITCCPEGRQCKQKGRCHLCHYVFDGGNDPDRAPGHFLLRGRLTGLTPFTKVEEWRRVFDEMYNDDSDVEHWVSLGRDCIKLARLTHTAIHWYDHMCMRTVDAFQQLNRPHLSIDQRIALLLDNQEFISTELAIYYRAIDKAYDARHILDDDVQPWTYRGRTRCKV